MRGAKVETTSNARRLRRDATIAEQRFWYRVRSRSLCGMKFGRQEPIGPYIVDFICREHRLIVEVDGGQHAENKRDAVRDRWLRDHGYRVLRFWNNDVIGNIEGVLQAIAGTLREGEPAGGQDSCTRHGASSPSPRTRGEGRGEGALPQAQTYGEALSPAPALPSPASGEE